MVKVIHPSCVSDDASQEEWAGCWGTGVVEEIPAGDADPDVDEDAFGDWDADDDDSDDDDDEELDDDVADDVEDDDVG